MSLLDKLDAVAAARKALLPEGIDVFGTPIEEVYSSTEAKIGGRRILFLGTNNYLGLTFASECLQAAHAAIDSEGTGTTDREWQMAAIAGIAPLKESLRIFIIATHALFLQRVIRQILLRFPAWRGPVTLCSLMATLTQVSMMDAV